MATSVVYFVQGREFRGSLTGISKTKSASLSLPHAILTLHTAEGNSRMILFRRFRYRNEVHSANLEGNVWISLWDNASLYHEYALVIIKKYI